MADIRKCVCGATPVVLHLLTDDFRRVACKNRECLWHGPASPTESEAIAAWNRVMRPRPVVTEMRGSGGYRPDESEFMIHGARVGKLVRRPDCYDAFCEFAGWKHGDRDTCHSWLIERLTAAGFDIERSA